MIKVARPVTIPNKLIKQGKEQTKKNCSYYVVNSQAYVANHKKFFIDPAIYNHVTVKSGLKKAQSGKCCFCEKFQTDEFGAVEHYRPKSGYKSKPNEQVKKPGYYWLGYEWNNLYFVCGPCNTYKGCLFPLIDESKRAKWHKMSILDEAPLLLSPNEKRDPRKHIVFDNHMPRGKTTFGKKTIEICKLDREGLNDERKQLLKEIDERILILMTRKNNHKTVVAKAIEFLKNCQKQESEFSAAASDYLKQFNIRLT